MAKTRPLRIQLSPGMHPSGPTQVAVLTQPGLAERLAAIVTIFLLAFELPTTWFRNQDTQIRGDLVLGGDSKTLALFLVLFAISFSRLINNGDLVLAVLRKDRLLVAFVSWILLSTIWSADPGVTMRRGVALTLTTLFAGYLVIRFPLSEILRMTTIAFAIGTGLSFLLILGQPGAGVSRSGWIGIFVNKNLLGRHEVMAVGVYLVGASSNRRWRVPLVLMALVSTILVVGSTSSTSLVGLIALVGNLFVFRLFRAKKTLFGAVGLSLVTTGVGAALVAMGNLRFLTGLVGKDVTFTGRTDIWIAAIDAAEQRPWTGWGWEAYWRGFFSPSHEIWVQLPWLPPHSHNAILDYLLVIGIPGAGLFLAMFAQALLRSVRYVRDSSDGGGLFPIVMLTFAFIFSLTEAGVVGRHARWTLIVVAILVASQENTLQNPGESGGSFPTVDSGSARDDRGIENADSTV